MSTGNQLSLDSSLRELSQPVCQSAVQIIHLPVEIRPPGLDECWQAFLCLSGTAKPSVSLACHGISDGVRIDIPYILRSVLEGRGFPFFGPFSGRLTRNCSPDDAVSLLRAAIAGIPITAGEFTLGWIPDDPEVPL